MEWIYLIAAGLMEVVGVIGVKRVSKKDNLVNNVILFGSFIISFQLLRLAMETIPLSTAYAIWTGIGTVGATIVGILVYRESKNPIRLLYIFGIMIAVAGLRWIN